MRKLKILSPKEERDMAIDIKNNMMSKDVISKYGISRRHFLDFKKEKDLPIRHKVGKYNCNENYFENIDTEDKAYFLGFILADGCVDSKSLSITQKELYILELFNKYIEFEGNIHKHSKRDIRSVRIFNDKIVEDLNKLGIHPNKTFTVEFPSIPSELEHHFMRGVFDGDGCISIHKHSEKKGGDRGQVNICSASTNFINSYVDKLVENCGIKRNKIRCPSGTYHVIDWAAFSDIEKFYEFFYKDATVYLERKKETFEKAITISKSKTRYRKS